MSVVGFCVCAAVVFGAAIIGYKLTHHSHAAGGAGLSVANHQLYRNGNPFYPQGFNMLPLVVPPNSCDHPQGVDAWNLFNNNGDAELAALHDDWRSNTVRLQISQMGANPDGPYYSQTYMNRIASVVAKVRAENLIVILSMQDEAPACGQHHALPSLQTEKAWQKLVPMFKDDPGVAFELYNEPAGPVPDAWSQWKNGGTNGPIATDCVGSDVTRCNFGNVPVGHQDLVNMIRGMGADNVLIVDGLQFAKDLTGVPLLNDPLVPNQIAYAVHPYDFHSAGNTLTQDRNHWQSEYGYLTAQAPVINTEWSTGGSCDQAGVKDMTPLFLHWLHDNNIGITAWAFDFIGTQAMVANFRNFAPADFSAWKGCSGPDGTGPGSEVFDHYTNWNPAPPPPPPPVQPPPPPSDTTDPKVSMTAPATGGSANIGTTVTLTATASDASGVAKVVFYDGSTLLNTDTTSPYSYAWNTANASSGTHILTAKAWDAVGNIGTSNTVSFTLSAPCSTNCGTTKSVNDSVAGTGLNQFNFSGNTGWSVLTTCNGCLNSDQHNTITSGASYQVQFSGTQIKIYSQKGPGAGIGAISIDGGTEKMVDTYASSQINQVLTYTSPVLANGTHTLKVRNTGTKNASSNNTFLIADRVDITSVVDSQPPAVSLTSPPNGSTYTLSCTVGSTVPVSITAVASDDVGVTKVEFYYDGSLLTADTSAPYSATASAGAGTHTLTATAYDGAGHSTASSVVSVTVNGCPAPGIPGDIDHDGHVNGLDLGIIITYDGLAYAPADLNGDGTVGAADMSILLAHWTW